MSFLKTFIAPALCVLVLALLPTMGKAQNTAPAPAEEAPAVIVPEAPIAVDLAAPPDHAPRPAVATTPDNAAMVVPVPAARTAVPTGTIAPVPARKSTAPVRRIGQRPSVAPAR